MAAQDSEQKAWRECDLLIARLTGEPVEKVTRFREYGRELDHWRRGIYAQIDAIIAPYFRGAFPRRTELNPNRPRP